MVESLFPLKNLKNDANVESQMFPLLLIIVEAVGGTFPCFSTSIRSLIVLNLAMNSIAGGIPTCIVSLEEFMHLNLSFNHLNYAISLRLFASEKLLTLDLSFNDLSGPLPTKTAGITKKSGFVLLDLSHNCFSGGIPLKIIELKSLQTLFHSHNFLNGEIPTRIGNLMYLQVINLSCNSLSGSFPSNIVGCFQLLALVLNNNNLSSEIQPEFDASNSLKVLDISNNGISGNLNDAITKWSNLRYLSLARNKFSGNLPSWLFTFEEIQMMDFLGKKIKPFLAFQNIEIKISVLVVNNIELRFNYHLSLNARIDLSDKLLHREISHGLFGLQGSRSKEDEAFKGIGLSNPGNISRLKKLVILNFSYNSFSRFVPSKEGYVRFPGVFAGSHYLYMESRRVKGNSGSLPTMRGKSFKETKGPISVWIFCISAFVSFYCCAVT
ncbi:hypothetical protein SADUNF_Sadunf13G0072700 [Salix dunnii]|uniref:Uncharacterized protein n=1 Tax=Salix dunnii TaxID=1413687 RepID=A0A835MNF3_9ROSI|nr:hypothetical protein SADUNF_Sadunf13G0072700 [Salix dunnii]